MRGSTHRVARLQSIKTEHGHQVVNSIALLGLPVGLHCRHSDGSHERRETLVQPQVRPPLHGHQVAEPLVGKLVGYYLKIRMIIRPILILKGRLKTMISDFGNVRWRIKVTDSQLGYYPG
jgi:hypothetical protein